MTDVLTTTVTTERQFEVAMRLPIYFNKHITRNEIVLRDEHGAYFVVSETDEYVWWEDLKGPMTNAQAMTLALERAAYGLKVVKS